MDRRYHLTKEIIFIRLRVPKGEAGHIQHLLEANDNLFIYSTPMGQSSSSEREMELRAPVEWEGELRRFIGELQKRIPVLIVEDRVEKDA